MNFFQRRLSRPLLPDLPPPSQTKTSPNSSRAGPSRLIKRVSTIFSTRKKRPHLAPIGNIAAGSPCSRSPSPAPSDEEEDIRRPSGLGPRAGSVASNRSLPSAPPGDLPSALDVGPRSRSVSSPNVMRSHIRPNILDPWGVRSPQMKPPVAVDVPVEILETIISYLPRWAVASLAVVSRSYYRAARNVLYRTLDLGIVGPERAEQLYALLAHRRELAHGVRTLICDDWPTASSRTPTPSSSASAFRAALSNMHNLTALTIPSFNSTILHDQLPFSLTRLTLLNVTMPLDEQVGLFEWLDTQAEITYLAFPNLIEKPKNDVPDKTKYHGSRLLFTVPILTPVSADLSGTYPLSSTPFGSPFLLPVLTSLHAPPIIATLLAPVRSLKEVTVHIQTTIYSGLRPSALMGALHGVQCLTVRFGENIDKRSVEKVLSAAGAVLGKIRQGSESLEILEVEVKWSDDEKLYKIITGVLPRFRALRVLRLHRLSSCLASLDLHPDRVAFPVFEPLDSDSDSDLLETENVDHYVYVKLWMKHCPGLRVIKFLSGQEWSKGN